MFDYNPAFVQMYMEAQRSDEQHKRRHGPVPQHAGTCGPRFGLVRSLASRGAVLVRSKQAARDATPVAPGGATSESA
jgi:hypothetical protein